MKFDGDVRVIHENIKTGRILVTSDIHGDLDGFKALLEKMEYTPVVDTLVIIGDLVQKGTQNLGTVRCIMELAKAQNVFVLMGNNDLFTLVDTDQNIFNHFKHHFGRTVLYESATALGLPLPETVEEAHAVREQAEREFAAEFDFLRSLPHILETDKFLFAHAGLADEDLEHQDLEYVLATPRFHETADHRFSKLLLVGHWPSSNYRADSLNYAPLYNAECNTLSIDGGTNLKDFGQLNGVILDSETGEWTWVCADNFPKFQAPHAQAPRGGTAITWLENAVELAERGDEFSRCRALKDGVELDIPNSFFYEDERGLRSVDITDTRLGVEEGETLSVLREFSDRLLVKNDRGIAGFYFK